MRIRILSALTIRGIRVGYQSVVAGESTLDQLQPPV